jgi:hypothetical protein
MSSNVRPALDTLRELDEGRFLDKLAVAIHDATSAVNALHKGAKIQITLELDMLSDRVTEPVLTIEAEINTKLPKPDGHRAIFYIDGDGNPTTQQQRQRDLGLKVAERTETTKEGTNDQ